MKKIVYLVLPAILIFSIYSIHGSYAISNYFQPYSVAKSNDILTLSIDASTYKQGDTVQYIGKVNTYDSGIRAHVLLTDSNRNVIEEYFALVNNNGIFSGTFSIPDDLANGKYFINAYYEGDSFEKQVSLSINIFDSSHNLVYISIPFGAYDQRSKENFDPNTVNVTKGTKIVWINNDETVHTVISGKMYLNGTITPNSVIDSGYLRTGEKYTIAPPPGKYTYFCKIHPWLSGLVIIKQPTPVVKPSTTPAKPSTIKPTNVTKSSTDTTKVKTSTTPVKPTVKSTNVTKSSTGTSKVKTSATPVKPTVKPTTNVTKSSTVELNITVKPSTDTTKSNTDTAKVKTSTTIKPVNPGKWYGRK